VSITALDDFGGVRSASGRHVTQVREPKRSAGSAAHSRQASCSVIWMIESPESNPLSSTNYFAWSGQSHFCDHNFKGSGSGLLLTKLLT
jgi:hypothetical protein